MDDETQTEQSGPADGRRSRRRFLCATTAALALGGAGTASAQSDGSGSGGGPSPESGSGSGVVLTAIALALTAITVGGIYLFSWRDRPEPTYKPETTAERTPPNAHTGPMYEADVDAAEAESVASDAFDPVGTGVLLILYGGIIGLAWLFMYFVEFLGNGPTVVG